MLLNYEAKLAWLKTYIVKTQTVCNFVINLHEHSYSPIKIVNTFQKTINKQFVLL